AFPGMVICLTGMNSEGITVSMHDSALGRSWKKPGSTPRGFILREAIETAKTPTVVDDIARVFRSRHVVAGNNIPVAWPYDGKNAPSVVFEYDGDTADGGGVTIRRPDTGSGEKSKRSYEICTNDYRSRGTPLPMGRYATLSEKISDAI